MKVLAAPLLLAACAASPSAPPSCPAGTTPAAVAELAFGRNAGGVPRVTDASWTAFLAEEATPRFPEGLTSLDAAGQWHGPDGRIEREASKLLLIVLPGASMEEAAARAAPLAAAYRRRFDQRAVLAVFRRSCAAVLAGD